MDLLLTDAADIADLVALVNAVPWDEFDCAGRILLNPFFGNVSPGRIGGADADLLLGTCLIDIKVIQSWVAVEHLRQIVGILVVLLNRKRLQRSRSRIASGALLGAARVIVGVSDRGLALAIQPSFQSKSDSGRPPSRHVLSARRSRYRPRFRPN